MTAWISIAAIILAALLASVITFLLVRERARVRENALQDLLRAKEDDNRQKETAFREQEAAQRAVIARLETQVEGMKASLEEQERKHRENIENELKFIKTEMSDQYGKLLKERQEDLSKGNRSSIGEILAPLKESIDKMQDAMKANELEHAKSTTALRERFDSVVRELGEKTQSIGQKADHLSEALTGKPKMQGCWGENKLDAILAQEGLVQGMHYDREVAGEDASRPDFVFHFKDGMEEKDLIVDSKVSLTAFVDFVNAESPEAADVAMKAHLRSIHNHIDELARKDYAKKVDRSKRFADYVVMFMPIDQAFRVALDREPMLWQQAYERGILITTEQTVMPFLKIVQLTWNKYRQDRNISEIMDASDLMIKRVRAFYDLYQDLGKRLLAVHSTYNSGLVKLQDSGQSIITAARNVVRLGGKQVNRQELEEVSLKALPEE